MERPIDVLTDAQLNVYNKRHAWVSGTRDARGRILGNPARIMEIPDRRVMLAQDALDLRGKTVTEFGCLEGGHTIALARFAKKVIAVDVRDENISKTKLRCQLYSVDVEVIRMNVEKEVPASSDVFFHSGVLYHLEDPVSHLHSISELAKELFLDTHHALGANNEYVSKADGGTYIFRRAPEIEHPRSGVGSFSRWIPLATIVSTLERYYRDVKVLRNEKEPAGPRASVACRQKRL